MATITDNFSNTATRAVNDLLVKYVLPNIVEYINNTRSGAKLTLNELLSDSCLGMVAPTVISAPTASAVIPAKPLSSLSDNLISKVGLCQREINSRIGGKRICNRPLKAGCDGCGVHSRVKAVKTTPVATDTPSVIASAQVGFVSPATSAVVPYPPKRTIAVRPGQGGLGLIEGVDELNNILVKTTADGKYIAVGSVSGKGAITAGLNPIQQKALTEYGIQFETVMPSVAEPRPELPTLPKLPDINLVGSFDADPDDLPGDDF